MLRLNLIQIILLISGLSFAQNTIKGKIYGDKTVAKYIKISNITEDTTAYSDENGNFSLKASVGDSLTFYSTFYKTKHIVVDKVHFSEVLVVQLKDNINALDEVIVRGAPKEKEFNPKVYNNELNIFIANDIENNPQEYRPKPKLQQGINLMGFVDLAKTIFPKKKKEKKKKTFRSGIITYYTLVKLNTNDTFISDTFFIEDLKIPRDFKYIFFEYFADQKISAELLNTDKRLLLIKKFFEISEQFIKTLNE